MNNETVKLVNVLRRIALRRRLRRLGQSRPRCSALCAAQYNRVLARLNELEPSTRALFVPLSEGSSPDVTRMAARDLAAYFRG